MHLKIPNWDLPKMQISEKIKIMLAVMSAIIVTLTLVGLTYFIFPSQRDTPFPPPGPYPIPAPLISSQTYALLLIVSFITAIGATVVILLLIKYTRQRIDKGIKRLNHC